MSEESKGLAVFGQMTSDVNVGMDEVVGVFVSRWEDSLYSKKDELSKNIKTVKAELESFEKTVLDQFRLHRGQYDQNITALGLNSVCSDVELVWDRSSDYNTKNLKGLANSVAVFKVQIKDVDDRSSYGSSAINKNFYQPISDSDLERRKEINGRLGDLGSELQEVLLKIKGVSRKERQIRGRISEMKLKDAGFEELIENPDLVGLIKLD